MRHYRGGVLASPETTATLLTLLWCPRDHGDLSPGGPPAAGGPGDGGVVCGTCGAHYPFIDGVLSFLTEPDLSPVDQREVASRDAEASWYDTIFGEYTNAVEVPTTVARIGTPRGPVLDFGAGTGRITTHLAHTFDQPVLALDYSIEQLRRLVPRCAGLAVLALHADGRSLPVRDGAVAAVTSAEVYEHFRPDDRARVLSELARVLQPGGALSISTLNFNLLYRLWRLRGNTGAKEGEHLLGGDFYYVRQTAKEFRNELRATFVVEEVAGIRNIPVRSIAQGLRRVAGRKVGDRFEAWMTAKGHRIDRAWERLPTSKLTGFFLIARCRRS